MNERIRQLAEQAEILITEVGAFHNTPQGAYQLKEQHMKKFAELIIREAIEACEKNNMLDLDAWQRSEQIKKHFGVEE